MERRICGSCLANQTRRHGSVHRVRDDCNQGGGARGGRILPRIVTVSPISIARVVVIVMGASFAAGCIEEKTPPPPKGYDAGTVPQDATPPPVDTAVDPDAAHPMSDGGAEAWAGTWQYISGSAGVTCGGSFSAQGVEGFLLIKAAGADALTVEQDGCTFRFALAGDTATKTPPTQACPKWAIPVIPEWTLTMKPDGTLEEKLGGGVSLGGEPCTISGRATLRLL
jgi:hypothetical protein